MKKLREERAKEGLCVYCGGILDREGIYCSKCITKTNEMKKNWRLQTQSKGHCVNCNKSLDREGLFCKSCANNLKLRARVKNAERRAKGLCVRCGEPGEGYSYCQICRDKRMDMYRRKKGK